MDEAVQGRSFKRVKQLIVEFPVLKYFNRKADTELQCDEFDKGLGASLMQDGQPVGYASRAMRSAEINYAQISKKNFLPSFWDLNGSHSMFKDDRSR